MGAVLNRVHLLYAYEHRLFLGGLPSRIFVGASGRLRMKLVVAALLVSPLVCSGAGYLVIHNNSGSTVWYSVDVCPAPGESCIGKGTQQVNAGQETTVVNSFSWAEYWWSGTGQFGTPGGFGPLGPDVTNHFWVAGAPSNTYYFSGCVTNKTSFTSQYVAYDGWGAVMGSSGDIPPNGSNCPTSSFIGVWYLKTLNAAQNAFIDTDTYQIGIISPNVSTSNLSAGYVNVGNILGSVIGFAMVGLIALFGLGFGMVYIKKYIFGRKF